MENDTKNSKPTIYVGSEEEARKATIRWGKRAKVMIAPEVLALAMERSKAISEARKQAQLAAAQAPRLSPSIFARALLKLNLFGRFNVDEVELEAFAIDYLKAKNEGRKRDFLERNLRFWSGSATLPVPSNR